MIAFEWEKIFHDTDKEEKMQDPKNKIEELEDKIEKLENDIANIKMFLFEPDMDEDEDIFLIFSRPSVLGRG